jgi:beta-glucosidase
MSLDLAPFGPDFTWGVAHASYQVEGHHEADGKGPSIWDTFTHTPGKVRNGDTGDVACDHYQRYPLDLDLVRSLGFAAQRFSISWPRIVPIGRGFVNRAGLDHYSRVTDACLERGIEPWVTLYHWDLPQALQDAGGWANRSTVGRFADYAHAVAERLGDRVHHWIIFNEPSVFTSLGYLMGIHAPGLRSPRRFAAAVHHVNLAQAAGARGVRAAAPGSQVGTSHAISPIEPPGTSSRHERALHAAEALGHRMFLEPNFGLGYPTDAAPIVRLVERHQRGDDEHDIVVDWDFLGLQYYTKGKIRPAPIPGMRFVPSTNRDFRRHEITTMGWEVRPEGIYDALATLHRYGKVPRFVITENGVAIPDVLIDGRVRDHRRIDFFRSHLEHVARARADGIPVDGFFCWSLLDNLEWAEGYDQRFGLVHVDFDTQVRTPKDSALWFQGLLADSP